MNAVERRSPGCTCGTGQQGMKLEPREERPGKRGRWLGTRGCWSRRFVRVRQSSARGSSEARMTQERPPAGRGRGQKPQQGRGHGGRDGGETRCAWKGTQERGHLLAVARHSGPASCRAGRGGRRGGLGYGGDNEMERNEAWGRGAGRRGGPAVGGDSSGISKGTRGPAPALRRSRELDRLSKPN